VHCSPRRGGMSERHPAGPRYETTERLFDAFFATKGEDMRNGPSVVEKHGGRIWSEACKGPGAKFLVCAPLIRGATRAGDLSDAERSRPTEGGSQ